jgi:hypothetical protein
MGRVRQRKRAALMPCEIGLNLAMIGLSLCLILVSVALLLLARRP